MNNIIHIIRNSARTAATLLLAVLMLAAVPQGAWADTESVNYIDADGNAQTVTATVLTGNEEPSRWGTIDLAAGWYVVKGNISYTNQISYGSSTGTIHIILADGAQMSVECNDKVAISPDLPLAIYGQSAGTGRLSVTSDRIAIYATGGITINGGIVSATSTGSVSSAIYADYGAITINGGQVTATPGDDAMGIVTEGTITLGLRSTSDFITANGFYGTVNIKDGQTLYAGATAYSGNNVSLPTGTVTLRPYSSDDFSVNDAGTEYTIKTAAGWSVFCDLLADNTKGYFTGKTVRLGDDITVTRMAGSAHHDFCGTFDGQGHTLTVSYGSADSPIAENNAAPFRNVESGCLIENLHVSGDIYTSQKFATGLVGTQYGAVTIRNCHVSTVIHSFTSGDGTHGGIVGSNGNGEGSSITIEGCLFDGKLLTEGETATTNCSGFVGYRSNNRTVAITNSLYAPADLADGETEVKDGTGSISATFVRNGAAGTNCYYTRALGTEQGKATRTVAAAADVTIEAVALTGIAIQYTVSGITAYSGGGLQRGETLYYGSGDQLSLTLSNSATGAPQGYQYGYTASAGTLSGSTLTMPDEDVTISVNTAALAPIDWATVNQGNSADPYMIYNKDQLLLLAHRVNGTHGETANTYQGKYFKLGADITFTHDENEGDDYEENYEAIGGVFDGYSYYFKGDFDGDGHTVSGIRIRKDGTGINYGNVGLFGYLDEGSNVHDVHLTDARITGYEDVGGIAGYTYGTVSGCSVTDSYITATGNWICGTICGENDGTLTNNYYHGCTVNGTAVTSGEGCQGADITANNGALPAYRLDLGANITTPPGTFAGQTEWLDTPPVDARLAPENGFTLAGNHYFASGYEFTPGSTLASGAAQGYTPRATLGDELLDLYTPTGDDDLLAGKAIARLTITADCDGKTLASTQAIYSTRQPVTVAYIKADGTTGETSAIALDGHETVNSYGNLRLAAGTYYVGTDIAYANRIRLDGDVTLILADGKTMTLNGNTEGIDGGRNLTIYGQSLDDATAGTLRYDGTDYGISANNYEQHSGNVSITTTGNWMYGIYAKVTLRGGKLTISANGDKARAISGNTHSILGGQLTATATGTNTFGILALANDGTALTLGWTRPADRITASNIITDGGTVAVADGKALTDGSGHFYSGTLSTDDITAISGQTLMPHWAGRGTEKSPYIISRTQELDLLAHRVNGTHGETAVDDGYSGTYFRLGADITYTHDTDWDDATSEENNFEAIGYDDGENEFYFSGDFDGAGHTISGIRIHRSGSDDADESQGIFGWTYGANIHGIRLADARITGYDYTGGIVGFNDGTVTDCHVASNVCIHAVKSKADYHGGIVGDNGGTVENCTSAATLTIPSGKTRCRYYGAIAGYNDGTLRDNLAIGATVPAAYNNTHGAIVGRSDDDGTLQRNYYTACKVAGIKNATGKGCYDADVDANDGAVPALRDQADVTNALALMAKLPKGTYPASFKRTFTAGKASTLCLPFAMSSIKGGKVYQLRDVTYNKGNGEWVATMIDQSPEEGNLLSATEAGKPYLFMPETSDPVTFAGQFTVTEETATDGFAPTDANGTDGWTMKGTYEELKYGTEPLTGAIFGFASKDKEVDGVQVQAGEFVRAKAGATVPALRAYLTYSGDNTALQARAMTRAAGDTLPQTITVRLIGKDGTVTATGTVATDTGELDIDPDAWYTLGGHLLPAKPTASGIYINNGHIVVIK